MDVQAFQEQDDYAQTNESESETDDHPSHPMILSGHRSR